MSSFPALPAMPPIPEGGPPSVSNLASNDLIARIYYNACVVVDQTCGRGNHTPWLELPMDVRATFRHSVSVQRDSDKSGPEALHDLWRAQMAGQGWTYGPVTDPAAKTHNQLVDFARLPPSERLKGQLLYHLAEALNAFEESLSNEELLQPAS